MPLLIKFLDHSKVNTSEVICENTLTSAINKENTGESILDVTQSISFTEGINSSLLPFKSPSIFMEITI